jgi:hypothetical protein
MTRHTNFLLSLIAACLCVLLLKTFSSVSEVAAQTGANSVGRYQIVNDPKHDGIFWVDTVTGAVKQCQWLKSKNEWACFDVR